MPAHNPNESIEGLKISGNSRDPLRYQRDQKNNGKKCSIYKAEFDVFAKIDEKLTDENYLFYEIKEHSDDTDEKIPEPLTELGEKIDCDSAIITSIEKRRKIKQSLTSNFSATHGTNKWAFNKQTNIKVRTPSQEIVNALKNRRLTQIKLEQADAE
jgi:hypothetical protein